MMFHGHNILVSNRRNAFEADARAARLAREARAQRQVTGTSPVRPAPRSVSNWWQSVRIRRQLRLLERAVTEVSDPNPVRDYVDSK